MKKKIAILMVVAMFVACLSPLGQIKKAEAAQDIQYEDVYASNDTPISLDIPDEVKNSNYVVANMNIKAQDYHLDWKCGAGIGMATGGEKLHGSISFYLESQEDVNGGMVYDYWGAAFGHTEGWYSPYAEWHSVGNKLSAMYTEDGLNVRLVRMDRTVYLLVEHSGIWQQIGFMVLPEGKQTDINLYSLNQTSVFSNIGVESGKDVVAEAMSDFVIDATSDYNKFQYMVDDTDWSIEMKIKDKTPEVDDGEAVRVALTTGTPSSWLEHYLVLQHNGTNYWSLHYSQASDGGPTWDTSPLLEEQFISALKGNGLYARFVRNGDDIYLYYSADGKTYTLATKDTADSCQVSNEMGLISLTLSDQYTYERIALKIGEKAIQESMLCNIGITSSNDTPISLDIPDDVKNSNYVVATMNVKAQDYHLDWGCGAGAGMATGGEKLHGSISFYLNSTGDANTGTVYDYWGAAFGHTEGWYNPYAEYHSVGSRMSAMYTTDGLNIRLVRMERTVYLLVEDNGVWTQIGFMVLPEGKQTDINLYSLNQTSVFSNIKVESGKSAVVEAMSDFTIDAASDYNKFQYIVDDTNWLAEMKIKDKTPEVDDGEAVRVALTTGTPSSWLEHYLVLQHNGTNYWSLHYSQPSDGGPTWDTSPLLAEQYISALKGNGLYARFIRNGDDIYLYYSVDGKAYTLATKDTAENCQVSNEMGLISLTLSDQYTYENVSLKIGEDVVKESMLNNIEITSSNDTPILLGVSDDVKNSNYVVATMNVKAQDYHLDWGCGAGVGMAAGGDKLHGSISFYLNATGDANTGIVYDYYGAAFGHTEGWYNQYAESHSVGNKLSAMYSADGLNLKLVRMDRTVFLLVENNGVWEQIGFMVLQEGKQTDINLYSLNQTSVFSNIMVETGKEATVAAMSNFTIDAKSDFNLFQYGINETNWSVDMLINDKTPESKDAGTFAKLTVITNTVEDAWLEHLELQYGNNPALGDIYRGLHWAQRPLYDQAHWETEVPTLEVTDALNGDGLYVKFVREGKDLYLLYSVDGEHYSIATKGDIFNEFLNSDTGMFSLVFNEQYTYENISINIGEKTCLYNTTIDAVYNNGDLNGKDGRTIADLVRMCKQIAKTSTGIGADMNMDGVIDSSDKSLLKDLFLNKPSVYYYVGGEKYAEQQYTMGETINKPEGPIKEDKTFKEWVGLPETMTDSIVVVRGDYNTGRELTYQNQISSYNPNLFYQNYEEGNGTYGFQISDVQVLQVTDINSTEYGYYYMYGTTGTYEFYSWRSKDLQNWEDISGLSGSSIVFKPADEDFSSVGLWAPEVVYDETTDKYYMFYTGQDKNNANHRAICMAVADEPYGPFTTYTDSEHVIGNPVFDESKLRQATGELIRNISYIDAHPFVAPDGTKYLYFSFSRDNQSDDGHTIWGIKMNTWTSPDYSTFTRLTKTGSTMVTGGEATDYAESNVNEGPFVYAQKKSDGTYRYYLTFSVNSYKANEYSVVQAVADNPMGPYRKLLKSEGGVLLTSEWDEISGTGHHCLVQAEDELLVFYHKHKNVGTDDKDTRVYAIDRVKLTKNGNGEDVLYVNGPTTTLQPKLNVASSYRNIATDAKVSVSTGTNVGALTDGLLSIYSYVDFVKEYKTSKHAVITLEFDSYRDITGLAIYNSKSFANAFSEIGHIEFEYWSDSTGQVETKFIDNLKFSDAYINKDTEEMKPGGSAMAVFSPMKVKTIRIELNDITKTTAISEIMILGK